MATGGGIVIAAFAVGYRNLLQKGWIVGAGRVIVGGVMVAGLALGLVVAPATGAPGKAQRTATRIAAAPRAIAGFTPAAADPRLAAAFARGGIEAGSFRFTPSESRGNDRAVTVAVRARTNRAVALADRTAAAPVVGLAPIAYNLGVAIGWKRFAVSGDLAKVDLGLAPGGRDAANVALSYAGRRFTGQVRASSDRPVGTPRALDDVQSYSLDVGGSYALTRNLDVTAGVRYKSDRDRLTRIADDRRDSQAVYIGTAFRF